MSDYIVSARKYRPMTFDSVVGQTALTTTLKNAVSSGKLAHAYLFCGPRGVGKTTCARIFAKVINCLNPTSTGDACGECESCKAFDEGRSLNIFELDAASNNGVEQIKALMEQTRIPPQTGRYKVFIIDEVHMLSTAAFNAFLKTLEEPPAHVVFILATTEKHKILPTIISRCQVYDFERMTVQGIIGHLKHVAESEGISYEENALNVIAEKADGGMRDALSIFDQAASFCEGNITYEKVIEDLNVLDADNYFNIIDKCLENKVSDIMLALDGILSRGFDAGQAVNGLASHVRNLLMALDPGTTRLIEASDQQRQRYAEQAKKCDTKFLYRALKILNQCDVNYRQSSNKRLLVELTLIQVAQITQADDAEDSHGRKPCKRLKTLFRKLMGEVATVAAASSNRSEGVGQQQKSEANGNGSASRTSDTVRAEASAVAGTAANAGGNDSQEKPKRPHVVIAQGMTFKSLQREKQVQEERKVRYQLGDTAKENKSFDDDDVRREWLSMCNRIAYKKDRSLGARMMSAKVKITEFPKLECVVGSSLLYEEIEKLLNGVEVTMAKVLHNGGVKVALRYEEPKETVTRLNPADFLKKLTEKNSSFAAMRKELLLELQ